MKWHSFQSLFKYQKLNECLDMWWGFKTENIFSVTFHHNPVHILTTQRSSSYLKYNTSSFSPFQQPVICLGIRSPVSDLPSWLGPEWMKGVSQWETEFHLALSTLMAHFSQVKKLIWGSTRDYIYSFQLCTQRQGKLPQSESADPI